MLAEEIGIGEHGFNFRNALFLFRDFRFERFQFAFLFPCKFERFRLWRGSGFFRNGFRDGLTHPFILFLKIVIEIADRIADCSVSLERDDMIADPVQEIAVVADHGKTSSVVGKSLFQNAKRYQIQIVCRLV